MLGFDKTTASRAKHLHATPLDLVPSSSDWNDEELVRDELLSADGLERHAEELAASQQISPRAHRARLLNARLRSNETTLLAAYRSIAAAVAKGSHITPAAEWLVDNYHLVEEQILQTRAAS